MRISILPHLTMFAAVLTGLVVPFLFFGRAVMAAPLLAAILIVALWLPKRGDYWRQMIRMARTPVGLLLLMMLALWVPSIFFSPLPLRSFEAWARIPVFVGSVTLLWAMLSKDHEALRLTFKVLLIASAIIIVLALASLAFAPDQGTSWIFQFLRNKWYPHRVSEILKEFSTMAILLMPVLLLVGRRLGARWPVLAVACVLGLLAITWMTYNRSAMAGLLAMLIVFAGLMVMKYRRPMVYIATSVFVAVVVIAMMFWLFETRSDIQPPEGVTEFVPGWLIDYQRQLIWHRAFEFGMDAPWFGNGINAINLLPGAEAQMPRNNLNIIPAHPHNWLAEVFAETGAVGAGSLVLLIATLCLKLAGQFLRSHDGAFLAALLVNIGYWSSGLLNVSFWSAWWQISYLLLTALCLAACRQRNGD
jgi:O-antigen ligase